MQLRQEMRQYREDRNESGGYGLLVVILSILIVVLVAAMEAVGK
jgi:hypothetical protein